jgi:hypothetical protein
MGDEPHWLTPKEAAAYLRTSRRNFDRLKIPRHILGMRTPRFLKSDLDAYMLSHRVEPVELPPLRLAPNSYKPSSPYGRQKSAGEWRRRKLAELKMMRSKSDGTK